MKKKYKNILKLIPVVLWPLVLMVLGIKICTNPSGFSLDKITNNTCLKKDNFYKDSSSGEFQKLQGIFSQKFYYLGSGAQSYAFVSEDQKYVIKFFKIKKLTPKYWLNYFPLPGIEGYRFRKIQRRERRKEDLFETLHTFYKEFRDESGLLFVHLNETKYANDKITCVDKAGQNHCISLNKVPFIVQKKAQLIYPYVSDLFKKGEDEKGLNALISLLNFIKKRSTNGFADRDSGVSSNYGFIDGKPVEIDLGEVVRDESIKDPVNYLREILRVSKHLEFWLQANFPDKCPLFLELVQDVLNNKE